MKRFLNVVLNERLTMPIETKTNHSAMPPFEYNQITPHLFVGTNACCKVNFKKELLRKGIRANISMEAERLDAVEGVSYFLWLPTVDHTAPTMGKLRVGTQALRDIIAEGEKVYVHCRNGHGRGPTLVVAYFILLGDDLETAHEKVKAKRPVIHIEEEQMARLKEFEAWCREQGL